MFGKVKKWLGIEGIKIELALPEMAFEEVGAVSGQLLFFSKNTQHITSIHLKMVEKYSRGRGKERITDEYLLGEITLQKRITVPADDPVAMEFTLPFEMVKSKMDEFGGKNALTGGLAKAAKYFRNVQSEFYIEAQAKVEGTALNPFVKKGVKMRRKG